MTAFKPGNEVVLRRTIKLTRPTGHTTWHAGCPLEVVGVAGPDRYTVHYRRDPKSRFNTLEVDGVDLESSPGHTLELTPLAASMVGGMADFLAAIERGTVLEDFRVVEVDRATGERREVGRS